MNSRTAVLCAFVACTAPTYAQVTLTAEASPAIAEPGSTIVTLTGSGFPASVLQPHKLRSAWSRRVRLGARLSQPHRCRFRR